VEILVCVKRVPATGGQITLTADAQDIDTRFLGFTVSPHEECAVEEAVRLVETHGGSTTVMTLGPAEAEDQLREAMAIGANRAVLLDSGGRDWDPVATAAALTDAIKALETANGPFDLLLFGNESADSGGFQVGIRVAVALDRPCVIGVKALEIRDGMAVAQREAGSAREVYELPLPAVVAVKEGINLPRYPSVPGRLRARKAPLEVVTPDERPAGPTKVRLVVPEREATTAEILGTGADAAPRVVEVLQQLGLVRS
jgi:electron transfer flavoprotein beta subunit